MKNLTKIFMAVAAGMLAFSCVTDATDDLAPELGLGEGQTTLTLSLEESRTHLGDKKADYFYPLYWSEGDVVSVNGTDYTVAISSENAAVASIPGVTEASEYCIAYPAAPAGQVCFKEKQNHVVEGDTFEDGVSTMYAYSESGVGVQLNHLTGILKFGITGSAKLSKLQVSTVNRDQIAGYFDFDFEKGELKESAGAKSVIEYSFGEGGLQLTDNAQYVHIAVPAGLNDGLYDELYVTLYEQGNSGNVMYATIKADTKTEEKDNTLKAGKVREFNTPITYVPNAQLFVINSVETLQEFKSAIESAEGLASDAIITEDIDMSEVADWEPINGESYVNTLVGNGYAIKGLKAPLFENTSASFKGVHLEDVAITTNDTPMMGALACTITATDTVTPTVEHCSASGTLTVKNETFAPTATTNVRYAGLVGYALGVTFDSCENNAAITVEQIKGADATKTVNSAVGGIVGTATLFTKADKTAVYTLVNNSVNHAAIAFGSTTTCNTLYIGGVLGSSANANVGVNLLANENKGEVSLYSTIATAHVGGVAGYVYSDNTGLAENNVNRGHIVAKDGTDITDALHTGGIFGACYSCTINTSTNHGKVEIAEGAKFYETNFGGIVGINTQKESKKSFDTRDCVNNGEIVLAGGPRSATGRNITKMGGIAGYSQAKIYTCTNNGDLTISGTINLNGYRGQGSNDFKNGTTVIAGIVGYKTEGGINGSTNHGDINITGTVNELSKTVVSQLKVAGITSYISTNMTNSTPTVSDGKISVSGTVNCELNIGGSVAFSYGEQTIESSDTDIEISGTLNKGLVIGGVIGWTYRKVGTLTYTGSINITDTAVIKGICRIGGCAGYLLGTRWAYDAATLTNEGTITVNGTFSDLTENLYIGGCVGKSYKATEDVSYESSSTTITVAAADLKTPTLTTVNNNGAVTFGGTTSAEQNTYIAGCIGYAEGKVTTVENNGNVTFSGSQTFAKNLYVTGGIGSAYGAITTVTNNATITFSGNTSAGNNTYVSGCVGYFEKVKATGLTNKGSVVVSEGADYNDLRLQGCFSYAEGSGVVADNCVNEGVVSMQALDTNIAQCSGIGHFCDGNVTNCVNKGSVNFEGTASTVHISGIMYESNGTVSGCVNGEKGSTTKGAINFTGKTVSGRLYFSGIIRQPDGNLSECENYGPITISGSTANTMHGGGITSTKVANNKSMTDCANYGKMTLSGYVGDATIEGSTNGADCFVGGIYEYTTTDVVNTIVRCENHGTIEFTETFKVANAFRVGGIFARHEEAGIITLDSCKNAGKMIMNGTVSARTGGICLFGGIVATTSGNSITVKGSLINSGAISFGGSNAKDYVAVGGLFGRTSNAFTVAEGETSVVFKNEGAISYTGSAKTYAQIGGITGDLAVKQDDRFLLVNTGDITASGTYDTTNTTGGLIGGICGRGRVLINGAQSFCNIKATENYYTGVGWITGSARVPATADAAGVIASNCKVGGKTLVYDEQSEDYNETSIADKYYNYIYGSRASTDWAGTENYDGCSPLNSAEEIVYPTLDVTE